jgi:hypothetical protein
MCNSGMFSLEFDLFRKSLTIFEKGPPTQPFLILLTSNYCHPPTHLYNKGSIRRSYSLVRWDSFVLLVLCLLCGFPVEKSAICALGSARPIVSSISIVKPCGTRPFASSTVLDYCRQSDR